MRWAGSELAQGKERRGAMRGDLGKLELLHLVVELLDAAQRAVGSGLQN